METDSGLQLPEDPQGRANVNNLEKHFLNMIEKRHFKVIAAGTAISVVTGQEIAKDDSNVDFHNNSKKVARF